MFVFISKEQHSAIVQILLVYIATKLAFPPAEHGNFHRVRNVMGNVIPGDPVCIKPRLKLFMYVPNQEVNLFGKGRIA